MVGWEVGERGWGWVGGRLRPPPQARGRAARPATLQQATCTPRRPATHRHRRATLVPTCAMKMAVVASYRAVPFMLTFMPSGRKKSTVASSHPASLAAWGWRWQGGVGVGGWVGGWAGGNGRCRQWWWRWGGRGGRNQEVAAVVEESRAAVRAGVRGWCAACVGVGGKARLASMLRSERPQPAAGGAGAALGAALSLSSGPRPLREASSACPHIPPPNPSPLPPRPTCLHGQRQCRRIGAGPEGHDQRLSKAARHGQRRAPRGAPQRQRQQQARKQR